MIFKNIEVLTENGYKKTDIEFNKKIKKVCDLPNGIGDDYSNYLLIPGLFDVHTHGAAGYDFNSAKSLEEMQKILDFYVSSGVTSVFPTLLTDTDEIYFSKLEMIYKLSKTNPVIKGIHIEGPF